MLSHICGNDRAVLHVRPHRFNDVLGAELPGTLRRALLLVFLNQLPPLRMLLLLQILQKIRKDFLNISLHRQIRLHILSKLCLIDIDMDHRTLTGIFIDITGSSVGEANTHGNHQVTFRLGLGGSIDAMHTAHAQIVIIGIREHRPSHHADTHRGIQPSGKRQQLLSGIGRLYTAAAVDKGPLRLANGLQHQLSLIRKLRLIRHPRHHSNAVLTGADLHILRNIDQHRSLSSGIGNEEGLLDGLLQLCHIPNHEIVLHHRLGDAHNIHLLEAVPSQSIHGYISGNGHKRHRIQVGIGNAGHQVCGTRTAGGNHNAGLAAGSGIAVCRMAGSLLMGGDYMVDAITAFVQLIVDVQHRAAGIAENGIDALIDQLLNQDSGSIQSHPNPPSTELTLPRKKITLQRNAARLSDSSVIIYPEKRHANKHYCQ